MSVDYGECSSEMRAQRLPTTDQKSRTLGIALVKPGARPVHQRNLDFVGSAGGRFVPGSGGNWAVDSALVYFARPADRQGRPFAADLHETALFGNLFEWRAFALNLNHVCMSIRRKSSIDENSWTTPLADILLTRGEDDVNILQFA
jgi:hypothetical protein